MVLRAKPFTPKPRCCKECGHDFVPSRPMQPLCSTACERAKAIKKAKNKPSKGFQSKKSQGLSAHVIDIEAHIIDGDERFVEQTEERHAARAAQQLASARETRELVALHGVAALISQAEPSCASIEKDAPIRNEQYRRYVASYPCQNCFIEGYTQHAHANGVEAGKGMGFKVDDRLGMALCCTRPGEEGCHVRFDQNRLLPGGSEEHKVQGLIWAAEMRQAILASGRWPKPVPLWPKDHPI